MERIANDVDAHDQVPSWPQKEHRRQVPSNAVAPPAWGKPLVKVRSGPGEQGLAILKV